MVHRFVAIGVLLAVGLAAGVLVAGRASTGEPPAGGMSPEMAEMMQDMMKMQKVGPEHAVLEPLAGKWTGKGTWTDMGTTSNFVEDYVAKMVFGGRFLQLDSRMTMPGMPPMNAVMFVGFDNAKRKYVQTMVSDWTTAILNSEGSYDAATKTFTMTGVEARSDGKGRKYRMVQKIVSPTEWTFEMYFTQPDGREAKVGDGVYKKA